MSVVVFPFKSEPPRVVLRNVALAARHGAVREVWVVGADDDRRLSAVATEARSVARNAGTSVEVFAQDRIGTLRPGKGDGVNTAIRRAAGGGHLRVHFYDADITNFDHSWIDGAEEAADRGYSAVRHRFPRAATDAMITWMITRPLLAKMFPGSSLPRLGQPLGGELLMTGAVVEQMADNTLVTNRSDWGIDTILTYAIAASDRPLFEHHVADGKRHSLYGSLAELRTMVVECLDAVLSLRGLPSPSVEFDADPPAAVPQDLKQLAGYDPGTSLPLLTEGWTPEEMALSEDLPVAAGEVLTNAEMPNFEFMDEVVWGRLLDHLLDNFRLGDLAWESLVFRLWAMRVLHYTENQASRGYDHAMEYLEGTITGYQSG